MEILESSHLKQRASSLPKLMESAYAKSTIEKYRSAWNNWRTWSGQFPEVNHAPANPFHVALYLNDLVHENCSKNSIINAFCGIRWGHINSGLLPPTDHPFVKLALEGAKRVSSEFTTKNQKEPISLEMISELFDKLGSSKSILDKRFLLLVVLGFAGFLRISELLDIQVKHVSIFKDRAEILLPNSKTDQLREGHIVHIARTDSKTCPVKFLENYLKLTNLSTDQEAYIICKLAKTKLVITSMVIPLYHILGLEKFS